MVAYPNPNRGTFELKLTGKADAPGELRLWDPTGKLVCAEAVTPQNGKIEIRLNAAAWGVYRLLWRTDKAENRAAITVVK
jgi:hypothetical protein